MESWSPESRSAVQDAFNALRETFSREAQHEVEQRLKADALSRSLLNDELEILRSRSENVDRLEQENRRLRSLLSEYHQRGRVTEPAKETTPPRVRMCDQATNTDVEPRQPSQVPGARQLRDAQRAVQKFNALDKNYKILRQHYKDKLRDANEKWEKYADSLQAKLERFEEQNGRAADHHFRDRPRAASAAVGRGAASFGSDPGEEPPAEGDPQRWTDPHVSAYPAPPDTEMATTDSTKGETTECSDDVDLPPLPPPGPNPENPLVLKVEPSSDGPVFVSERHVGKRKLPSETPRGGPEARRIKIESSSLSTSLPNTQLQPESMDLDDVGQRLSTPRKNRHHDAERATTEPSYVRPDSVTTPASRLLHASVVLTPVDPNVRSARAYEKIIEKPLKKGLARGISAVAEDAEDGQIYEADAPGGQLGAQFRTPQPLGRLTTLLNMPSPERTPAIIRSAPRLRGPSRLADDEEVFLPGKRELPFSKQRKEKQRETVSKPKDISKAEKSPVVGVARNRPAGASLLSSEAPLRSKPVSLLGLEHFKPNPRFNDGVNYVYSEVVRGKDNRAGLTACTSLECCPEWRRMALVKQKDPERTRATDALLFEDFLGDDVSQIWGMSPEERESLWVEAKTAQLAKEFGKHKHRFHRQPSPPGFWNADFPTTQEVQAEKVESEKRDAQKIQERYREAMKRGRWLFRDE